MRLLVLGAGPGQLGLLAAARARDLFVVAVDRNPGAPGFRYADRRAILPLDDEPALDRLVEAAHIDGVVGTGAAVATAARMAARFGLPHPISPQTAVLCSSVVRQRERFLAAGVPQARWKLVGKPDDELGFPCVVKAADRARGAAVVRSRAELRPAVRAALRVSRSRLCLIEEVARGPEVRVIAFSRAGSFHPLVVWPDDTSAAAVAERAAEVLGVTEGPTTTVLRLGAGGPRVVSLTAGIGDAIQAELCEVVGRVDLNALTLAAALGEDVAPEAMRRNGAAAAGCIRFRSADAEALA